MPNMANICKLLSVFVALDMFSGTALAKSSEELRESRNIFDYCSPCRTFARVIWRSREGDHIPKAPPGVGCRPAAGTREQFGAIIWAFIDTATKCP